MSRQLAQSYKRHPVTEDYDAIVIGSGIGGLACAAMLAKHGHKRVLVLERHYTPGGFTHVFHRPGYEWDVGVHYVGEMPPGSTLRRVRRDQRRPHRVGRHGRGLRPDLIGGEAYDFPKGRRTSARRWCRASLLRRPRSTATSRLCAQRVLGAVRSRP